jgi:hypothetical protein
MVAETSIRPIRSAKILGEELAVVIILLFLQIFGLGQSQIMANA